MTLGPKLEKAPLEYILSICLIVLHKNNNKK